MYALGAFIKSKREALQSMHSGFSIRCLAKRVGIHHSYLSKLERGEHAPLTEDKMQALARELGEDPEVVCALGGKLTPRLSQLIRANPTRFVQCILDLEHDGGASEGHNSYSSRLENRKNELEELSRRLKTEIARREMVERELIQKELEKRRILNNLNRAFVLYLDRDMNIVWHTDNLQECIGIPKDMVVGDKCYNAFHGRSSPCDGCSTLTCMQSGEVNSGLLESRDGRKWTIRNVPIINDTARIDTVVRFGFDISEIEKTRKDLADSEQRWKFALEGTLQGVWDLNPLTNKTFYSKKWKSMLSYDECDILDEYSEWESRIHPNDLDLTLETLHKHLRGETLMYEHEYRIRCKDGSYKWMHSRGFVVERSPSGAASRVIGVQYDISKRKQNEADLITSNVLLNAVFNSIQEGATIIGNDMSILMANKQVETWYKDRMPVVGKKCYQAFHNRDKPCNPCPTCRALQSGVLERDIIETTESNDINYVELFAYPVINPDTNEVVFVVEFVRDITLMIELERRLAKYELVS
jgi:PAS domain S-box-containing protein